MIRSPALKIALSSLVVIDPIAARQVLGTAELAPNHLERLGELFDSTE